MQKDIIDNDPLVEADESRSVGVIVGVRIPFREAETTEEQI
ncbi:MULTISPECIES: hypothetical protein [Streptomycetaceae]|nr:MULTISPECIES: hypothetical protein [Streptomycetaceae]